MQAFCCLYTRDTVFERLPSYLSNQTQKVWIGLVHSDAKPACLGIPWGSILKPILITLYAAQLVLTSSSNMVYRHTSTQMIPNCMLAVCLTHSC